MKCDHENCSNQATVHLIEIDHGKKVEKHLCEAHAVEEGVAVKMQQAPISELLAKFVPQLDSVESAAALRCDQCGMTYEQFRKGGLLGCADCYTAFEGPLMPLLQRAHEGAGRHLGKVPTHAGADELRQQRLRTLRRELEEAVASEEYERAARLRDQVSDLETKNT